MISNNSTPLHHPQAFKNNSRAFVSGVTDPVKGKPLVAAAGKRITTGVATKALLQHNRFRNIGQIRYFLMDEPVSKFRPETINSLTQAILRECNISGDRTTPLLVLIRFLERLQHSELQY